MTTNARDEKWSEWYPNNGVDPIPKGAEFEVKTDNGEVTHGDLLANIRWRLEDDGHDIIAYRYKIKEPESMEVTDAEEEAWQAKERELNRPKYSAYFKDVRHIDTLDVYRVVSLFDCEKHGHPISHAAKKLLLSGSRTGGKDVESDVREAIDTLHRWLEMREEDARA